MYTLYYSESFTQLQGSCVYCQTQFTTFPSRIHNQFNTHDLQSINITGGRPSTSVNGDIATQWEWSNFDPSQNQNPLTDYDKTLHNWLRPRDEHVTQNLCQSTLRERLGKYVKYKALSSFILIYFFPGLTYWSDPWTDFHEECLKLRAITQGSAFLGSAQ